MDQTRGDPDGPRLLYSNLSRFSAIRCSSPSFARIRTGRRLRTFSLAFRDRRRAIRAKTAAIATVELSNQVFNEVCRRATSDLYILISRTPYGLYPYAGTLVFHTIRTRRDHHCDDGPVG